MGTDIHAAIEYWDGYRWTALLWPNKWAGEDFGDPEPEPAMTAQLDFDRNYNAFAILANVRNGRGFAGVITGEGFNPLSDHRGLPDDITKEGQHACSGDHSDTHVYLDEILAYDWTQQTTLYGVVDAVTFEKWDRVKEWDPRPDSWCGSVGGGNTKHVSVEEMRETVAKIVQRGAAYEASIAQLKQECAGWHTRILWQEPYTRAAGELWTVWVPVMLKLGQKYRRVRMVMNFDS